MARSLNWEIDGRQWPNRGRSRFIDAGGLRWHVQHWPGLFPGAPLLLLVHGTGSATHSWRRLAPLLAPHFELLAMDLPGHGFSGPAPGGRANPDGAGMHGMARRVAALLSALGARPRWVLGHSAGAAIAVRMALHGASAGAGPGWLPHGLIALNAAMFPLPGAAGALFSPVAKLLALNPLVPHLFAWRAQTPAVVQKLLESTGSVVDAEGDRLYRLLVTNPAHVAGALAMVARWDLPALAADLPRLRTATHFVVGEKDGTVPPTDSARAQALVRGSTLETLAGLGHLAHEEDPQRVADAVLKITSAS
jgi:magnesium chelatase accessory protein